AGGLTVGFRMGSSTGGQGTFSAAKDLGNGQYTAVFTGTLAGKNTILAYINGQLISSGPSITVVPGSLSPMKSPVTISSTSMKAGGTVTVTLQPEDIGGNKLNLGPGQTVAFSIASGLGTLGPVTANKNGTYSATFTTTTAGSYYIETSINDQAVTSTIMVLNVSPAAVSLTNSVVTVSEESVQSGSRVTVTLKAVDAFGNLEILPLAVAFKLGGGSGNGTFGNVTYSGNGLSGDGIYQATFTGTKVGSTVIEALIDGFKVKSTALITVTSAS
ncbi:MAG TPA: invasin domain 3-containing protein, partial [Chloroflexota bacterium]|nr:invasin domain 3-containing protein [Chloroflexota bacterium]